MFKIDLWQVKKKIYEWKNCHTINQRLAWLGDGGKQIVLPEL